LANRPPIAINLQNPTAAPCLVVLQGLATSLSLYRNRRTSAVGSESKAQNDGDSVDSLEVVVSTPERIA